MTIDSNIDLFVKIFDTLGLLLRPRFGLTISVSLLPSIDNTRIDQSFIHSRQGSLAHDTYEEYSKTSRPSKTSLSHGRVEIKSPPQSRRNTENSRHRIGNQVKRALDNGSEKEARTGQQPAER